MTNHLLVMALFVGALFVGGCNSKSAAHGFCMGSDGTAQDCKICCDVDKAKECCDKLKQLEVKPKAE